MLMQDANAEKNQSCSIKTLHSHPFTIELKTLLFLVSSGNADIGYPTVGMIWQKPGKAMLSDRLGTHQQFFASKVSTQTLLFDFLGDHTRPAVQW